MWRNNTCKRYLVDKRVCHRDAMLAEKSNKSILARRCGLEPGMSAGGLTLGRQCIMMDPLTLSLRRKSLESLPKDLIVELLLNWLDPDSALILALTVPRFYQVYKGLFPQPININNIIEATKTRWRPYFSSYPNDCYVKDGLLDAFRFNLWYPNSHYIYNSDLKITTEPEKLGRYERFGRFLSREVYDCACRESGINIPLKKLKQRYLQHGMYNAMFLRLTGVVLEHPHNLGENGWNDAVVEMLEGVVATMDNPASLLKVTMKGQHCFPWPGRLRCLIAENLLVAFGEWINMMKL
ncbi:hypothetical protein NHQ30_011195 [Ciborinia camelliae]|nr:hypothetical protein NHQ30_011195 [Ciborinia camelliae]